MVQDLLVGLIVAVAVLYSLWILMPAATRRGSAARVAALARGFGLGEQGSHILQEKLAKQSGCGACDGCKGCAMPFGRGQTAVSPQPGADHPSA